jgi:hypothetical protein
MLREKQKLFVLLALMGLCLFPSTASALIMVANGNEPVANQGWPTGSEEVANLPSRLGYMEGPPYGGGLYHFEYRCKDTADFNNALQKFGAIRVPRLTRRSFSFDGQRNWIMDDRSLVLVVHDWVKEPWPGSHNKEVDKDNKSIDWTFTIWVPENFHSLYSDRKYIFVSDDPHFNQPVPPPRIDVYLGGDSPIVWKEVKVPANARLIDTRKEALPVNVDDGGVMIGGIFDMATHQVIAGADVILVKRNEPREWKETARTKTDKRGSFVFRAIPEGYYEIHISADGYSDRNIGVFDNRKGHEYHEFDTFLIKEASCSGVVQDKEGNPIPGVKVSARDPLGIDGNGYKCVVEPSAITDQQGFFELKSLPEGFTHIRCQAPSLHQETSLLDIYKVSTKKWIKSEDIKIVMSGTGLVRGKVVGIDGKPPKQAFIAEIEPKGGSKIGSWGGSMYCSEDGSFEFKGVPPGEYVVIARPRHMSVEEALPPRPVTVTAGKTVELEIVNN